MEIMDPSDYGRGMRRRGIGGLSRGMNSRMAMGRPAYPTPMRGQNFDLPSRPMGMQDPMGGYQPAPPPSMGGMAAYTPPGQMPAQAAAQPIGAPGYRPPAMGMDFSVGAPGTSLGQPAQPYQNLKMGGMGGMGGMRYTPPGQNIGQPASDPRQQQEMKRSQQAFNDARVSMPAGQQFQPPREQAPLINQAPQFDPRMIQRDMPSAPRELPGYATPMSAPPPPTLGMAQSPGDVSGHFADIQNRYGLTDEETNAAVESKGQSLAGRPPVQGATTYSGQPMGAQQQPTGQPMALPGYAAPPSPTPPPPPQINIEGASPPQQFSAGPDAGPQVSMPQGPPPFQNISQPSPPPPQQFSPGPLGQPQQQAGPQAQGGAKWTMEIKPSGGMYGGGIIGLAQGGVVPGYFLGNLIRKVGKAAAKIAPLAVGFIPGIGGLAAPLQGLIGGAAKGVSDLAQNDWDFDALNVDSILQHGMGAAFMAKAQQDPEWAIKNRNKIEAMEKLSSGQAGGQGTSATANRMMPPTAGSPGASGARGGSGSAGVITDVEQGAAQKYNMFNQLTGKAGGGQVGSLYAMRRFGGGPIKGYQEGGEFEDEMDEPRYRPPPRRRTSRRRSSRAEQEAARRREAERAEEARMAEDIEPALPATIAAPPPPPPPPPRRKGSEEEYVEDIEPALPATVAALRPPPPPAPPPVAPWQPPADPGTEGESEPEQIYTPPPPAPPPVVDEVAPWQLPPDPGAEGETLPDEIYSAAPNTAANYAPEPWQLPPDPSLTGGDASTDASSAAAAEAAAEAINAKQRQEAADYAMRNKDYSNLSFEEEVARQKKEKQTEAKQELIATNQLDPDDKGEQVEEMGEPDEQDLYTIDDKKAADMKKDAGVTPSGKLDLNTGEVTRNEEYIAANTAPPLPPPPPPPPVPETFAPAPTMEPASGGLFGAPTERQNVNMFEGASGFDPFNMPTQASQFANADPRMEAMLNRMNTEPAALRKLEQPKKEDTKAKGKAEGGVVESMQEMPEVMEMLQMALQAPDDPQSQEIISTLMEAFGEEDFQKLVASLQAGPSQGIAPPMQSGGKIPGNGDAMADDIRLTADAGTSNAQDIDISSGEFVVAGDVVSHLGSGNTDRGANVLSQFQEDVRVNRTGSPEQAPPIDLEEVLPGTYGERYA